MHFGESAKGQSAKTGWGGSPGAGGGGASRLGDLLPDRVGEQNLVADLHHGSRVVQNGVVTTTGGQHGRETETEHVTDVGVATDSRVTHVTGVVVAINGGSLAVPVKGHFCLGSRVSHDRLLDAGALKIGLVKDSQVVLRKLHRERIGMQLSVVGVTEQNASVAAVHVARGGRGQN